MEVTGGRDYFAFLVQKTWGLFVAFYCQYHSQGTNTLHKPWKLLPVYNVQCSKHCHRLSLRYFVSHSLGITRHEPGWGETWSWKLAFFPFPYPRNGENYLFPCITFEIPLPNHWKLFNSHPCFAKGALLLTQEKLIPLDSQDIEYKKIFGAPVASPLL